MKTAIEKAIILKTELQYSGTFLEQHVHTWQSQKGTTHKWEFCQRKNTHGAVAILALLKPSNHIIIVEQFRPPLNATSWEFPAGLIDANESLEQAACRELKEECGLIGTIVCIHPPVFSSPGLTSESISLVEMHIDENAPENLLPETDFDESEYIFTHKVALKSLHCFLEEKIKKGDCVDAKLYAYSMALNQNK